MTSNRSATTGCRFRNSAVRYSRKGSLEASVEFAVVGHLLDRRGQLIGEIRDLVHHCL